MTVMLEVAIGLVFVYLVLSLLASAIAEAIEHLFRYRADYLRQGVEKLLLGNSDSLRQALYEHALIASLSTPSRLEGKYLRAGGPAYIPSRQFALALLDIVSGGKVPLAQPAAADLGPAAQGVAAGAGAAPPASAVSQLLAEISQNTALPSAVKGALRTLISDAGDDMEKVKANVQQWFDGSMDRVAGWYKRRAQFILVIIGAVVAVVINVDSLAIVNTLSNDSAVRSALVTAAETYIRENPEGPAAPTQPPGDPNPPTPPPSLEKVTSDIRTSVQTVSQQLGSLGLPVGWRWHDPEGLDRPGAGRTARETSSARYMVENRIWPGRSFDLWWHQLASHLLGWLLTAIAVSFGAPFWFDTLNKIMVIRSTVKPREKSGEEGSEDRKVPGASQTLKIEVAATK
jgi:hypothetical protein